MPNPDQAAADIDAWAQGLVAKADRYRAAQERTEQLRLTAASRDGSVRVTVRADGSVDGLELSGRARSMPLDELSALIMRTMRQAQGGIADRVSDVMAEEIGDEDPQTRSMMVDNLRTRFPNPEAEEEDAPVPPAPDSAAPPRAQAGDDDEGNPW
ncbi:MAG TPA: YbaB/EbfC family nucleoid-associated protein [Amycolatopsis sp.]|nr:YbaB/EbfC family nucleoid-associated protein [Amycolatopsis sp.]